ncbi:hypothetical protein K3495_g4301 [Podosphaera aphanis]|nr:hypothetical protein K3495_g4301 [Podosphaera aphanis]
MTGESYRQRILPDALGCELFAAFMVVSMLPKHISEVPLLCDKNALFSLKFQKMKEVPVGLLKS